MSKRARPWPMWRPMPNGYPLVAAIYLLVLLVAWPLPCAPASRGDTVAHLYLLLFFAH